ncbi:MAG TPA: RES domain-containing protein [Polyangia bacterium]|nr:RES domain-containing protein [Polyangia bacterium]
MTPQRLDRALAGYRIGDPKGSHPIFDATGSKLYPGRWNTPSSPMLYCSEHHSTAMLEKLVHGSGSLPPHQHFVTILIPNGTTYEVFSEAAHPGWDTMDGEVAKAFGEAWQRSKRTLLLIVPSIVARVERNFLLNPDHPDFARVEHGLHHPVWWDDRLFARA